MVVDKTKQVTVATLLEDLKNRPKIYVPQGKIEVIETDITSPLECSEKLIALDKWFEDFEGLLLQFQKQLSDDIWELTEQELIRHKQAHPQRLLTFDDVHAIVHKITKQISGDVAK